MGDLLVLREDWDDPAADRFMLLAELVAVKDECAGMKKRFIWRFDNVRLLNPFPGVRDLGRVGRVSLPAALTPKGTS